MESMLPIIKLTEQNTDLFLKYAVAINILNSLGIGDVIYSEGFIEEIPLIIRQKIC